MVSSAQTPSLFPGAKVLKRFFSPLWWQHTFAFSWHFRRHLLWTAIFFLLFSLIMVYMADVSRGLKQTSNLIVDAGPFLTKLVGAMIGLTLAGIFFLCGMFLGVLKLTAFTRAFLYCPLPQTAAALKDGAYKLETQMCQSEAIEAMSKHKAYLARAWFLATLIMLPGVAVAAFSFFTWLGLSQETAMKIPEEYRKLAIYPLIIASAVGIMLNNYSVVTLTVTSMTNRTIGEATRQSLLLALTTAPLMTVVSASVLILTTVITTPYAVADMLQPAGQMTTAGPLPVAMAWQVWQVLTGIMVYPIGTALMTEVVRDLIVTGTETRPAEQTATTDPAPTTDPVPTTNPVPSANPAPTSNPAATADLAAMTDNAVSANPVPSANPAATADLAAMTDNAVSANPVLSANPAATADLAAMTDNAEAVEVTNLAAAQDSAGKEPEND